MTKSWEELTEQEQLASTHYDLFKDVHGFRPRFLNYDGMSVDELRADIDSLCKQLAINEAEDQRREAEAVRDFEELVELTIRTGAHTRENAIRWLFEAENDPYIFSDPDHYCYRHGLPYGYFKKVA